MSSHNKTARPCIGRLVAMTFVCAALFFSVTGFKKVDPIPQKTLSQDFAGQLGTIMSHNLVVNTTETRCLALNIYWEARSEPLEGQLAVAGVTMNRVADSRFPDTICDVVQESKSRYRLHRCQFSWWCDGKKDDPLELTAWRSAQQVARLYLAGIYTDPTSQAKWYHADYVNPVWADRLNRTTQIGRHIFYSDQTETQTASLN
ncbi:cell wall hydrolase [Terasakiella pusilla]|uniref:cell wall hydrolase n=1 Tax=Terasakiella pusilla TaxID=64973 RepID=UPI003AA941FA